MNYCTYTIMAMTVLIYQFFSMQYSNAVVEFKVFSYPSSQWNRILCCLPMMHFEIEPFTIENILLSLTSGKNINTSLWDYFPHTAKLWETQKEKPPVAFYKKRTFDHNCSCIIIKWHMYQFFCMTTYFKHKKQKWYYRFLFISTL